MSKTDSLAPLIERDGAPDVLAGDAHGWPTRILDPVVFLPGMLGDACVFADAVAAMPLDIVAIPGRIDLDATITEMAVSVLAGAPERFALAGHSLGGIVALEMLRLAPQRITRVALLNTSARPPNDVQLRFWRALSERTEAGEFEDVIAEQSIVNLGDNASERLIQQWSVMARRVGAHGFVRQLAAQVSRVDLAPYLAAVAVPALVLSGSADNVCPSAVQAEIAAGVDGARHVIIDGAGHMAPLDHPAEVARHLTVWNRPLNRVGS
ncbi:MAG: alpha/beta hydrolase [Chloroflexota bacterium]